MRTGLHPRQSTPAALVAASVVVALIGLTSPGEADPYPFDFHPPDAEGLKACRQKARAPEANFDWMNWDGGSLPFTVDPEQLLRLGDEFATGIGPHDRDPVVAHKIYDYVVRLNIKQSEDGRVQAANLIVENPKAPQIERERAMTALQDEANKGNARAYYTKGSAF